MKIIPVIRLIAVALFTLLFAGCATTEPLKGRADLLDFLADGRTTRAEALLHLGHPSGRFEHEKIFTYRLAVEPKHHGYYVVERESQPTGWSTWSRAKYSLVLVFDESGLLREHSLVEVN